MFPSIFHFRDACRLMGVLEALRIAARWGFQREFLVLRRDLRAVPPPVPVVPTLRWTSLTEAQTARLQSLNPALGEKEMRRRWREGQECRLGWMGDGLIHCLWWARGPVFLPYLGRTLRPGSGEIVLVESFTHPAWRGRGIHSAAVRQLAGDAEGLGLARCLSLIAWWNTPSLRAARKTGGVIVGTVGYRRTGLRRHYFATGDVRLDGRWVFVPDKGRISNTEWISGTQ